MNFKKVISAAAATAVATTALAVSSSALLAVPENAASGTSFGTGMWMVKLYCPSEGVDNGFDPSAIAKIEICVKPVDTDWFEGMTGGALFTSCGPTSLCPSDHNWVSSSFWGVIDEDAELETQDPDSPIKLEKIGDYTYKATLIIDDSNCIYSEVMESPDAYVQVGIQEWGSDMSEIEVLGMTLYNAAGETIATVDASGNVSVEAAAPAAVEEEPAAEEEDTAAEEEAPAVEEAPVVEEAPAPAAGDVAAATDSSKGSPDTGIADVAAIAGLAVVAAGAIVVAKKSK